MGNGLLLMPDPVWLVSRRLSLLPGRQAVTLELAVPCQRRQGQWVCLYRIRGLGRARTSRAVGDDGLHALQLALAAVRRELEPFAGRLTWAGQPGELGLPESVPDYFGGEFRRRVEALVRREVEAEARRLRTAATAPNDYDGGMRQPPVAA
ncbi:MAG TPA: hypothetical protein VFP28_05125, partial [Gemmatimonadales bacterium]|nr:hypothetical protein [Gemmatimonadales bacterium]